MQKVNIEFVIFDSRDVIMTSGGGGQNDDLLTMIWLSNTSVDNYNAIAPAGAFLLDKGYFSKYEWIAYSGQLVPPDEPEYFYPVDKQNTEPTSGVYTVRQNNTSDYQAVLNWLQKHSKQ